MTEPTAPPERPLPDDSRARIRADLLAHAQQDRSATPRWAVPAAAAAAVALVAGLTYWAINPWGAEVDGVPATGGGTSGVTATPSLDPTVDPSSLPSNQGTATPTAPGTDETIEVGTRSCEEELEYVMRGAQPTVQVDASMFYVKGDRFALCDVLGGRTTVHQPLSLTPRIKDVATYAVSSVLDGKLVFRVAGGIVPEGSLAYDVAYAFPDGHTERAKTVSDAEGRSWWYVAYSYADPGGNEMEQPEIEVTVSLSGVQYTYPLEWGVDTCAQANHGC